MRPTISPPPRSKDTSSRAVTPPNTFRILRTSRTGAGVRGSQEVPSNTVCAQITGEHAPAATGADELAQTPRKKENDEDDNCARHDALPVLDEGRRAAGGDQ